jgi:hypothetical protein
LPHITPDPVERSGKHFDDDRSVSILLTAERIIGAAGGVGPGGRPDGMSRRLPSLSSA